MNGHLKWIFGAYTSSRSAQLSSFIPQKQNNQPTNPNTKPQTLMHQNSNPLLFPKNTSISLPQNPPPSTCRRSRSRLSSSRHLLLTPHPLNSPHNSLLNRRLLHRRSTSNWFPHNRSRTPITTVTYGSSSSHSRLRLRSWRSLPSSYTRRSNSILRSFPCSCR